MEAFASSIRSNLYMQSIRACSCWEPCLLRNRARSILLRASANRFWKVMGALFDEPEPLGIEGRTAFLYAHGIALWDVLSSCAIVGASMRASSTPLRTIFRALPRRALGRVHHGSKATALYRRFGAPQLPGLAHTGLPSTSPANARMRLDDLVKAYLPIRETLVRRDGGGR
ncbi:MAG: DNA-deoxyinosine glycosylase [Eggerthella lenta]